MANLHLGCDLFRFERLDPIYITGDKSRASERFFLPNHDPLRLLFDA